MSEYILKCPHCNSDLKVSSQWSGKEINCPVCSTQFTASNRSNLQKKPSSSSSQTSTGKKNHLNNIANSIAHNELSDFEEDNYVLDSIEILKKGCLGFFCLCCASIIGWGVYFISSGVCMCIEFGWNAKCIGIGVLYAFLCLLLIVPLYITFWILRLFLCWFRGIYRNSILR